MVIHPNNVVMTERQREIVQSTEQDFPYVAIDAQLDRYAGGGTPWHWHDYFEIAVVHSGRLRLGTPRGDLILEEGEGYFLNANVLHMSRSADADGRACIHAQLFAGELLSASGLIVRRYVSSIENCPDVVVLPLRPGNPAEKAVLDRANAAFAAADSDAPGYELSVCANLTSAWGDLFRMLENRLNSSRPALREDVARAKAMLSFIRKNYAQPLTVARIAAAAGICERECFRCFAEILDTTPMACLNRHRMGAAARMLREGNLSVARIAEDCGFSGASYFGKVFRREMGCTPGEFRRKNGCCAKK